jgi:purine-binding chemotaxis protein CheW
VTVTLPRRTPDGAAVAGARPTWFDDAAEEPATTGVDHVVIRLGGGRYAVCAPDVAEVVAVPTATRLPGTPAWVVGVGNWRGHVLPLVDLRSLLGLPVTPLPSSARLVVLAVDDVEVGLLAEAVAGLLEVPETLSPAPVTLSASAADLLLGLADSPAGAPVAVLSTAAVLSLRGRLPRR